MGNDHVMKNHIFIKWWNINKVCQISAVILVANEAKNAGIAEATASIFNEISGQKDKIMGHVIFDSSLSVRNPELYSGKLKRLNVTRNYIPVVERVQGSYMPLCSLCGSKKLIICQKFINNP